MKTIWIAIFPLILLCKTNAQSGSWQAWREKAGNIPQYIYPLTLEVGDVLTATLSWSDSADLDLYLYQQGSPLLVRSGYLARAYSNVNNPQILTYTITTSGVYYLRPDLYSTTATSYTLSINKNTVDIQTDSDYLMKVSSSISLTEIDVLQPCSIKILYTGPSATLYLYPPSANITDITQALSTGATQLSATLPVQGKWRVTVSHGITSTLTLSQYSLDIQTDSGDQCQDFCSNILHTANIDEDICICESGYYWNEDSSLCQIDCSVFDNASASLNISQCDCSGQLIWNPSEKVCEEQPQLQHSSINCSEIDYTEGQSSDGKQCECQKGYIWVSHSKQCIRDNQALIIGIPIVAVVVFFGSSFIVYRVCLARKVNRTTINPTHLEEQPSITL